MIKLVKTIVDENRKLIGFVVEGKERELEGFSDEVIQKSIPLRVFFERGFRNNQVEFTSKTIKELGNFKINKLPMVVYKNNQFIPIDNGINLVKKFIHKDEIVGFTVKFADGSEDNMAYNNIIQLSYWFRPDNFVIRSSATGKKFIHGKPGVMKLEDLPTVIIGEKSEHEKKRLKSAAKSEEEVEATGLFTLNMDIIDLYAALKHCEGLVIKLPDEKYIATQKQDTVVSDEFQPLGVGEYAYANLQFNETKLNANTVFRKPGMVNVEFGPGVTMPIQSFTYSTKSIFVNGENYIKRFGVAIPKQYENEFVGACAKSMSLKPITNQQLIQSISSLTGKHDLVFYEVDTNKIDLIAKSKVNDYILSTEELYNTVRDLFIPKALVKYLSPRTGLIAELKKKVKIEHQQAEGKEPLALYAGMTPEFREKIRYAGIDIYTGAFLKTKKVEVEADGEGAGEAEDDITIAIDYMIDGLEYKKWTYKKIAEAGLAGKGLPQEVIDVIQRLDKIQDLEERMREAYKLYDYYEKKAEELKRKLWLHKAAMYIASGKRKVHQHDKDNWVLNTNKKTKAKIYNCVLKGCEGLMVAVINTDI